MKKEPNSRCGSSRHDRSLPRKKILRGRHNFQRLFDEESLVLRSPTVHFRYRVYENSAEGCLIGFIVKKKLGKAAERNKIKRLLREVYRTHQHLLTDLFAKQAFGFHGVFMAQKADLIYQALHEDMVPMIKKIRSLLMDRLDSMSTSVEITKNDF